MTTKTKPIDHRAMGDRAKTFKGLTRKIERLDSDKAELLNMLVGVRDVLVWYYNCSAITTNITEIQSILTESGQLIERMKGDNTNGE